MLSSPSSFAWVSLDAFYKYCTDNNIVFKEWSFIWGVGQAGNLETDSGVKHTIDTVNAIVAAGAPIHAFGCETHDAKDLPSSTLKANIDKIASSTGLPIYITEYDLNIADDDQQRAVMQDHVTMFWNNSIVKGITYFGYIVGATWRTSTGLMQSSGSMRPAMIWLMDFLGR